MNTSLEHQRSKQPATPAAGPYGHPFHPVFVTVPIGAWTASLVFDIASKTSDDGNVFVRGSVLLIGVGIVGAIVAAVFGLMDYSRLASGTRAQRTATVHLVLNVVVLAVFALSLFIRRANADADEVSTGLLAMTAVALGVLGVSGWLGGMLSYHFGVRVADEGTQAEGFEMVGTPNRVESGDDLNAPQIDIGRHGTPPPGSRSPEGR